MPAEVIDLFSKIENPTIEQEMRYKMLKAGFNPADRQSRLEYYKEKKMTTAIRTRIEELQAADKQKGWSMKSIIETLSPEYPEQLIRKVIVEDICGIQDESVYINKHIERAREKRLMEKVFEEVSIA